MSSIPPSAFKTKPWEPRTDAQKILEASENFLAASEMDQETQLRKLTGQAVTLDFRKPKDILRAIVVPPFTLDEAPDAIGHLAKNFSAATGYDASAVMMAAIVGAASMIGDHIRLAVRPRSNWHECARLWAVLVGLPSDGKTPSIKAASEHIAHMHKAQIEQWLEQNREKEKEERTPRPALFSSDATIPALEEVLKENPQGILLRTNEFSTWIGMIDGASKGEGASNRGNWLQLYDGGPKQSNRINRGDVFIPNWSACVLAACTPDGLRDHMQNMPEDGLIHRFLPVVLQRPTQADPDADSREAEKNWSTWLEYLRTLPPCTYQLSLNAERVFEEERRHVQGLAQASYDFMPALAAQLGKHGGQLARVALTYHCIGHAAEPMVSEDTMWRAIKFMRKTRRHVAALFDGILTTSPVLSLSRALGRSILAEAGLLGTLGRTWMSDHCAEFKKADDRTRREAVQMLEDADWLESDLIKRYGGWPTSWRVNPQLYALFGQHGEEHRKRREAVREAIGLDEPDDWT